MTIVRDLPGPLGMPDDASLAATFVGELGNAVEDAVDGEELLIAGNFANAAVEHGELIGQL
jgi:hypothetical protein